MDLHEFQAKEILHHYGIPIPEYRVIETVEDIETAIRELQLSSAVIKIQVHAGGRGKGGGIAFAKTQKEIKEKATSLLGMKLVNNQTGPQGVIAHKLLITAPLDIEKEYYLGATIDRVRSQATLIASPAGGMEIEEIAKQSADKIIYLPIQLNGTMKSYHLNRLLHFMGWKEDLAKQGSAIVRGFCKAFIEKDASLLEINPLALNTDQTLWAIDAKLSIDDNALFRHNDIAAYFDPTQVSHQEVEAGKYDLSYIALSGTIGCMVNGAGLAMATMDIIQYYGGSPANFLDVGGSATKEKVAAGCKIILEDPKVKVILVNIFGGIMSCATIAEGIISAISGLKITIPIVVRLEGTNVDIGKKMIKDCKLQLITANDLADAAKQSVQLAGK